MAKTRVAYQGRLAVPGTATLVAGTKVVPFKDVTANSIIMLAVQSLGTVTTPHPVAITARTPGVSFTISSDAVTDTSVVAYSVREP